MLYSKNEKLSPVEELANLKSIYGETQIDRLYKILTNTFNVLQNRAQTLLSLITITLTITGFSGPRIAESSQLSRYSIAFGLSFVLLSALILMTGPLRLSWGTQWRSKNNDEALIRLIQQRNFRTNRYHIASFSLIIGLIGYVTSLVSFLITG